MAGDEPPLASKLQEAAETVSVGAASRMIVTVYVFVFPASAVTVISNGLSPSFSDFDPVPVTVADDSAAVAEIVLELTEYGTLTV